MKFTPAIFLAFLCTAAIPALAQTCSAPSHYKVIPLPLHPARLNNSTTIAGTIPGADDDSGRAALWTQSSGIREPPIPAGFTNIELTGLNASGDVVGQATSSSGKTKPFAIFRGKFKPLSDLPWKAKAINDARQIALEQSPGAPQLWTDGEVQRLGGCCGGRVFAISNHSQIVGELNDREGRYSAFLWDAKNGVQLIAPPKARNSTALAINDSGHILIQGFSPNQIYLRENGKFTPVELSPEFASQPLALNDCDVIVGEYGTSSDYYHAFIWDKKNGFRDLNKLIDISAAWNLEQALDINNRGEIVGTGDHQNESDAGFLLIPDDTTAAEAPRKP